MTSNSTTPSGPAMNGPKVSPWSSAMWVPGSAVHFAAAHVALEHVDDVVAVVPVRVDHHPGIPLGEEGEEAG